MLNLIRFELRSNRKLMLIWSVSLIAILLLYISLFPSMQDQMLEQMSYAKLDALPEGFLKALNISANMDMTNIVDYLNLTLTYALIGFNIFAMYVGINIFCKEEEQKTIAFLANKPLSRSEIYFQKVISAILIYLVVGIAFNVAMHVLTYIFIVGDQTYSDIISELFTMNITMLMTGFIYLSLGFLIGVFASKSSGLLAFGLYFVTYIFGVVAKLVDKASDLIYLSPTNYFYALDVINNGYETKYILLASIIVVVSFIVSYGYFVKKDFHV